MKTALFSLTLRSSALVCALGLASFSSAIELQNGTATFSQSFDRPWNVSETTDGITSGTNGWAIYQPNSGTTDQTAVWETVSDFTGSHLRLVLDFNYEDRHLLGKFRFATTTDDRSTFADGLQSGGDVTANWTVITPSAVSVPASLTSSVLGDGSILLAGSPPNTGSYTIDFDQAFSGITGLRLEALKDSSLPSNGPGLQPNGNFVLSEITASPVPEPSTMLLVSAGLAGLAFRRRR